MPSRTNTQTRTELARTHRKVQRSQKLELQVCPPDCSPLGACAGSAGAVRVPQSHYTLLRPQSAQLWVWMRIVAGVLFQRRGIYIL